MKRRNFLASILAASIAPAIVRAESLMQVVYRPIVVATAIQPALEMGELIYRGADGFWHPLRKDTEMASEFGVWNGREAVAADGSPPHLVFLWGDLTRS